MAFVQPKIETEKIKANILSRTLFKRSGCKSTKPMSSIPNLLLPKSNIENPDTQEEPELIEK